MTLLRDAIHTHFVTLIGKETISFLPTHPVFLLALSRDVLLHVNLATLPHLSAQCLTHPPTIVHFLISVTKWVWMASLIYRGLNVCLSKFLAISPIGLIFPIFACCREQWGTSFELASFSEKLLILDCSG